MGFHRAQPVEDLAPLLSTERLRTYERHAPSWGRGPVELYLLGVELAASMQADLALVEVCVRNRMHDELSATYGSRWWADPALLDDRSQSGVAKAWADARCRDGDHPGKLIAHLPFGFWVHLLESGGYVGAPPFRRPRSYEELLWRPALHRAFPHSPGRRVEVHRVAHLLYALRNRIAHHEPIIYGVRRPGVSRSASDAYRPVRELHDDAVRLLGWISPSVGEWLAIHSRTPSLLDPPRPGR